MPHLSPQLAQYAPVVLFLVIWMIVWMAYVWYVQRGIEAKFAKRIQAANKSLEASRQFQEETRERAKENDARMIKSMERAEQSLAHQVEMIRLLREIADRLPPRS